VRETKLAEILEFVVESGRVGDVDSAVAEVKFEATERGYAFDPDDEEWVRAHYVD
jgi:hypothetical protein